MFKKMWKKKNLHKSDAQQPKKGSNPTGNLRFSQAHYKKDGEKIDQTTYFRNDVFNKCDWKKTENGEKTKIDVTLVIDNNNLGHYKLNVTHELHRESGQDNVTDVLHWGEAIDEIRNNNIKGKDLTLYRDEKNNFKIEIK